jgi:hypothetical protein
MNQIKLLEWIYLFPVRTKKKRKRKQINTFNRKRTKITSLQSYMSLLQMNINYDVQCIIHVISHTCIFYKKKFSKHGTAMKKKTS